MYYAASHRMVASVNVRDVRFINKSKLLLLVWVVGWPSIVIIITKLYQMDVRVVLCILCLYMEHHSSERKSNRVQRWRSIEPNEYNWRSCECGYVSVHVNNSNQFHFRSFRALLLYFCSQILRPDLFAIRVDTHTRHHRVGERNENMWKMKSQKKNFF